MVRHPNLNASDLLLASLIANVAGLDRTLFRYDILDYIEDPHEAARWMFDQQQQMIWPFKKGSSRSVLAEDAKVAAAVEDAEQSARAAAAT